MTLWSEINESFFGVNIVILKIAGVWIPDQGEGYALKWFYWIYNVATNGFCLGIFMPCEFLAFGRSRHRLEDAIKNASVAVTHLLGGMKVLVWLKRRKVILRMISELEEQALQYDEIDDFQPRKTLIADKRTKNITTLGFLTLGASVSITALLGATAVLLRDYERHEEITVDASNVTAYKYTQPLPYWAYMPFDYTTSRTRFFWALVYNCFTAYQQAWTIVGIDTLFTALVSNIGLQLTILRGAFKTIRSRSVRSVKMANELYPPNPTLVDEAMDREMKKCVRHLQLIFDTCKRMEEVFTYLTLTQVIMSEIIICTCLYLVSSIPITSKAFATELVYLVAIELQIGLYCFFGNKVTIMGEDISLALYEGDWLLANSSFKKSMLITMLRMKKPIYLTMGKFSPLTLSTFVTIGKGSYSFFAVLKNHNA
ncbi:hypothetical protein PPYR_07030 [Photinus pyralis]|uniref:Odorant receptor n=1 Tax=Photinus pyralis TaxID=7054 RepID=A0A5N4AP97_PHOPY|nr:odorant receptor 94a-like [Photinus pyralis]KAB0799150.1 hypothetical protein PPYR_07030 [Photinus pyralis]